MIPNQESCKNALERQVKIAQSLTATLAVLNSNQELKYVLDFIVNQARGVLGADAVAIYTPQNSKTLLKIEASQGLTKEYIEEAVIPLGMAATGLASLSGSPVTIQDIFEEKTYKDLKFDKKTRFIIKLFGAYFRALLVIPLFFSDGEVYGTLDLYYKQPCKFSEEEISLAKAYANQTILAIENTRLRTTAKRSAVLAERNRLARELHDTVTQTLFSISLISGVLPELWLRDQNIGLSALEELNQLARGAQAEMRTLLFELRPKALSDIKLETLIHQLVDAFSTHTRISVNYTYQPINPSISENVKVVFYRIVQEALRNIEKHGRAANVIIQLEASHKTNKEQKISRDKKNKKLCISVMIEDDGVGFYQSNLSANNFGIRIMHERASEIGAILHIESEPGDGTRIELTWQCEK